MNKERKLTSIQHSTPQQEPSDQADGRQGNYYRFYTDCPRQILRSSVRMLWSSRRCMILWQRLLRSLLVRLCIRLISGWFMCLYGYRRVRALDMEGLEGVCLFPRIVCPGIALHQMMASNWMLLVTVSSRMTTDISTLIPLVMLKEHHQPHITDLHPTKETRSPPQIQTLQY